jgi:hypothetical protein
VATTKRKGRKAASDRSVRRKNLNIDQAKLDRVRELLGAATETQAGARSVAGTGGIENPFENDSEP